MKAAPAGSLSEADAPGPLRARRVIEAPAELKLHGDGRRLRAIHDTLLRRTRAEIDALLAVLAADADSEVHLEADAQT